MNIKKMIELKKEYNKHFGKLSQAYRDDRLAIYAVNGRSGGLWYEVFKIRVRPANRFVDDEFEAYPSDEDFGVWAWSCSNLDVVKKVLCHPTRGHFGMTDEEGDAIIAQLLVSNG